jgi:hypothetical protein
MTRHKGPLFTALLFIAPAGAETVILKDGSFVEGNITLETSRSIRVETPFGTRMFQRKDIDQIIESLEMPGPDETGGFHELPPTLRAVLNAQADYKLGNYERATARLAPHRQHSENRALRIQIDWLAIEVHERLGQWQAAKDLLDQKQANGTPREQIRARAHLDLFKANPDYDLRFVGEKHARNFIRDPELLAKAREPGALKDARLMRLALEEYCEQLLVEDKLSVKAFADRLVPDDTFRTLKELAPTARIEDRLPYMDDLKKAEASIYKAQAVLADYGLAFETDLVRTELSHLLNAFTRIAEETLAVTPENFTPPSDPRTGQLTPQGRVAWRERCDEFLRRVQPLDRLSAYMLDKAQRDPRGLRSLNKLLAEFRERLDQIVNAVKRARERTHV